MQKTKNMKIETFKETMKKKDILTNYKTKIQLFKIKEKKQVD